MMIDDNQIITEDKWGAEDFGMGTVIGSWSTHYKSWKKINFAPIVTIKYEDLINDTKSSLLKIINFLQKFMNIKRSYLSKVRTKMYF